MTVKYGVAQYPLSRSPAPVYNGIGECVEVDEVDSVVEGNEEYDGVTKEILMLD